MSKGDRRERLERILKDAEPALDQPSGNEKKAGIGDVAGRGHQVVVGNDNLVITDTSFRTKAYPLRRATRLLWMGVVVLCVPFIFCVERTCPPDTTVTGPIPKIATDSQLVIQPADAFTPTDPLTIVPIEPGFHFHAGCAFFRAPRTIEPAASQMGRDVQNI